MKKPKPAKFKLNYLQEIARNACLHATQPKETTYPSIFQTPVPVLRKMVMTLQGVIDIITITVLGENKFGKGKKGPTLQQKGLKAAAEAIQFTSFCGNRKKSPKGKRLSRKP